MKSGEVVGFLGFNGVGKIIIFYMICGFLEFSGGSVYLNDVNLVKYFLYKCFNLGIGYLF